MELFALKSTKKHVEELELILENVVMKSKSESVILCGPSGCGKSSVVEQALATFRGDKTVWNFFQCVYIDGLSHGDPKASVDHILAQVGAGKTRANGTVVGSAAEKLRELCEVLNDVSLSAQAGKKGFLFIIDHLEIFIEKHNQMLLYHLFDTAHANSFPICVIGISTVLDVLEKLEKRVKSRFSHRIINVSANLFPDLAEYKDAMSHVLNRNISGWIRKAIRSKLDDPIISAELQTLYDYKRDWGTIHKFVYILLACRGTADAGLPDAACFKVAVKIMFPDTTVSIIKDLPHLHLALLFCCFEYVEIHNETSFNFCMIREVYLSASKQKVKSMKFGESVIAAAYRELETYGLLKTFSTPKHEPWEFTTFSLCVARCQLQMSLSKMDMDTIPTDLRQWCKVYA